VRLAYVCCHALKTSRKSSTCCSNQSLPHKLTQQDSFACRAYVLNYHKFYAALLSDHFTITAFHASVVPRSLTVTFLGSDRCLKPVTSYCIVVVCNHFNTIGRRIGYNAKYRKTSNRIPRLLLEQYLLLPPACN